MQFAAGTGGFKSKQTAPFGKSVGKISIELCRDLAEPALGLNYPSNRDEV